MSNEKVSVVIPAFNSEKYIAAAIESVLGQTYDDVECIVVDDGSADRTAGIAGQYGDSVLVIKQENSERSVARNNGILHASGKYVSFLDADDYYESQKIAEQVDFLERQSSYDAVYSKVRYFHEGAKENHFFVNRPTPSGDILASLLYQNFITVHSPLIRRTAIERVGGFDPTLNRYEDWDFFLRLAIEGSSFAFLDKFHAYCRIHEENTVSDRARMFESKLLVAEKVVNNYGAILSERGVDCRAVLAFHKADFGRVLILTGEVQRGQMLIKEACEHDFPHKLKFVTFRLMTHFFPTSLLSSLCNRYKGMLIK